MDLEKKVMVAGRGILFPGNSDSFEGFRSVADCDYIRRMEQECRFVDLTTLGPDDKRIFSYITFLNVDSKEVYAFIKGGEGDKRRISIYIEGPVYSSDARGEVLDYYHGFSKILGVGESEELARHRGFLKVLKISALREINKQVRVEASLDDCHGFVNLEDQNYRNRFGLLYFALTKSQGIRTHSRRTRVLPIGFAGKRRVSELETEGELDLISKALLEPLREYFNFL